MDIWFSNINATVVDQCQALGAVAVKLTVIEDLVTAGDVGFSLQMNAFAGSGASSAGQALSLLQYVIIVHGGAATYNWQAWTSGNAQPVPKFTQPPQTLPAVPSNRLLSGSEMSIALVTTDDHVPAVAAAIFMVQLPGAQPQSVFLPFPADNPNAQFPIVGFQLTLIGWSYGAKATFTSGAGMLTYSAPPGSTLSVQNSGAGTACGLPSSTSTAESSNVVYGAMSPSSGASITQPFRLPTAAIDAQLLSDGAVFFLAEDKDLLLAGADPAAPSQVDQNAKQFQALSADQVCVLGSDGNLWIEKAPWNDMEPPQTRQPAGNDVIAFQALGDNEVYVIDGNHNLWQRTGPWSNPAHTMVAAGSQSVQAFPTTPPRAYVLDTAGTLWGQIGPWGANQTNRQVDTGVRAFQGIGVLDEGYQVFVLDTTGNLYYEFGLWGTIRRARVDGNVRKFQMISETELYVLGDNGKLWLEQLNPDPPGFKMTRVLIDEHATTFHALDTRYVCVIGTDGKLWVESAPWGPVPPHRYEIGRTPLP